MPLTKSILNSTKKMLGLAEDYDAFDMDVVTHINSAFSELSQLGVGPSPGFMIEDDSTEWAAFTSGDPNLSMVPSYIYFKVRLAFDPPQTSFGINAIQEEIKKLEWRLNAYRETTHWTNPEEMIIDPSDGNSTEPVLDGGVV